MKTCTACGVSKDEKEFLREARVADGLTARCRDCINAAAKRWKESPEGKRYAADFKLRTRYGVSLEEFEAQLERQGGRCASCKKEITQGQKSAHLDHDHETGEPRGVLCSGCNRALGFLNDDREKVAALLDYLDSPPWKGAR